MNLLLILSAEGGNFSLITPDLGLVFWTALVFVILWVILGKTAFGPITQALKDREKSIEDALGAAEKARAEMASLTAKNEALLMEAKEERNRILQDAKDAAEKLRLDIVAKAQSEAEQKLQQAIREIENQKTAALIEVKNTVGLMALDIAEKLVRKELAGKAEQVEFVNKMAQEAKLN
jgi:F-type H+-transporting ATPase subunit b